MGIAVAIRDVKLVRSGASDLHGSSAIGGVINVIPSRPTQNQIEVSSSYGGDGTFEENLLAGTKQERGVFSEPYTTVLGVYLWSTTIQSLPTMSSFLAARLRFSS
jgi:outer membrane cobalamin receptor